jgi:hydroxymethylglutaryl-CoA lyase
VRLPDRVVLREVGLRDGIQSLAAFVATADKVSLLDALSTTGLRRIEATSFVHPSRVPQMADAAEVLQRAQRRPGVSYEALVPNARGLERAAAARADSVAIVTAASDAFNLKNLQMTVEQSLAAVGQVKARADQLGLPSSVGIATSFGCPYSGEVALDRLLGIIQRLVDFDIREISLADTTGMANPLQVERTLGAVLDRFGDRAEFGLHFHNTRGAGLANVLSGLRAGITTYDASVGGIGGCPFAPRATGNISTEDAVHMLHEMGVQTGIDLEALIEVARQAERILGQVLPGQVMKAGAVDWHPAATAA